MNCVLINAYTAKYRLYDLNTLTNLSIRWDAIKENFTS